MYSRSRFACGDSATFSGILHVTHMTWRSITGSEVLAAEARAGRAGGRDDREQQRSNARRGMLMCVAASVTACCRNGSPISPREIATIRPCRLMMKLSGSWSVP